MQLKAGRSTLNMSFQIMQPILIALRSYSKLGEAPSSYRCT